MCLILENQQYKITDKDIIAYKVLNNRESIMHDFIYDQGVTYETSMNRGEFLTPDDNVEQYLTETYGSNWRTKALERENNLMSIGEGFHSCKTIQRARILRDSWGGNIYECVIPAGSQYYEGFTDLLVSNRIIVNGQLQN